MGTIVGGRIGGPNRESFEVERLVPTGPNPAEPPSTSIQFEELDADEVGRLVPAGPNPAESPSTTIQFEQLDFGEVERLVPGGPDPAEPPESPPTVALSVPETVA